MKSKIKWVKNSRIKKYPKICASNVVEKESDVESDDVVVTMTNVRNKYPTINVKFSRSREGKERREREKKEEEQDLTFELEEGEEKGGGGGEEQKEKSKNHSQRFGNKKTHIYTKKQKALFLFHTFVNVYKISIRNSIF